MPDWWQMAYFGNLNQTATGDFDGDGISNLGEFLDGTNPTNSASFRPRLNIATVGPGGGSVSSQPTKLSYDLGESVTLAATPIAPSIFCGWEGDLGTLSNPAALTMGGNKRVVARFAAAVTPPPGLVACWRGEADASDLIGGHNGTFYGGTSVTGPSVTTNGMVGGAFAFDGTVHVRVPDAADLRPAQVTVEAWVYPTAQTALYQTVAARGSSVSEDDTWYVGVVNGLPHFWTFPANDVAGPAPIPVNQWTHLAATFDGATKRLYVNGTLAASQSGLGPLIYDTAPVPVTIGSDWAFKVSNSRFNGRVDEVSLYNRALTADEVAGIAAANRAGKDFTLPCFTSAAQFPPAYLGLGYTQQVTAVLGTAPVSFSLSAGLMAPGLTLSPTGTVSGTSTAPGIYNFTLRATDAAGLWTDQACTLQVMDHILPPSGLAGWWRAENDAQDAAGTNNGVLRGGAAFAPGEVGQSFLLNGTSGSIDIPDAPALRPASITLEAWVMFGAANGLRVIFAKPVGAGTSDSFGLYMDSGTLKGVVGDATGLAPSIGFPFSPTAGRWYHLAYTFDDTAKQQALYLDGVQVASGLAAKAIGYDSQPMLLGRDSEAGVPSYFFQGRIDEAAIYSQALSAAQIASIHSAGPAGTITTGPYFSTPPLLPEAIVGQSYTQAVAAIRGTPPVLFGLAASALPDGLTLSPAGVLSGMPTQAGVFDFVVRATDGAGVFADQGYRLQIYAAVAPPPGLVAWWRAENDAQDAAGTNNGLLRNGAGFASGRVGQAFALNGTSASIEIPDAPALRLGSGTLEALVKFDAANGTRVILAKPVGAGLSDSFALYYNGTLNGGVGDASGFGPALSFAFAPALGRWYHVAYTFADTRAEQALYLDGLQVARGPLTRSAGYDNQPVLLGRDSENGLPAYFFAGRIDEAALYSRALSTGEVAAIYSAGPAGKIAVGPSLSTPPLLPEALIGQIYAQTFTSIRGTAPVIYGVSAGTVPPDLTLTPAGLLSGTPSQAGRFDFVVRATDGGGLFAELGYTLEVFAPVAPPAGLVAWWRAENDAQDAVGTNHGVLLNGATFAAGKVGRLSVLTPWLPE